MVKAGAMMCCQSDALAPTYLEIMPIFVHVRACLMVQAVAELEGQVNQLTKDQASRQQAQQRLEVEVARLKEGISKNRVKPPSRQSTVW